MTIHIYIYMYIYTYIHISADLSECRACESTPSIRQASNHTNTKPAVTPIKAKPPSLGPQAWKPPGCKPLGSKPPGSKPPGSKPRGTGHPSIRASSFRGTKPTTNEIQTRLFNLSDM